MSICATALGGKAGVEPADASEKRSLTTWAPRRRRKSLTTSQDGAQGLGLIVIE
jgi:hypothetical protein